MQTGAQLLDERVPLQIREQALVTDNVHTSLPRKTPLSGCLSELQTFLSMEESNSTAFSFNETTNPLGSGRSLKVLVKDYHLRSLRLRRMRHCQEITRNAMTNNSRIFSGTIRKTALTAVVCFGVIGVSAVAIAPPAEANQRNRQLRRENRQLRRVVRHDRRDWNRYRRNRYSNGRAGGYRPLRPAYAYGYGYRDGARYYRPSGFHVQIGI